MDIVNVTAQNVSNFGVYCIKDKKLAGYKKKVAWYKKRFKEGLKIKIAIDESGKQLGFIEYVPTEFAWRPIKAKQYLFIQCIGVFTSKERRNKIGTSLIKSCEEEAKQQNMFGVCTMTSKGAWMANSTIFLKNNYSKIDNLGRFDLYCKKFSEANPSPNLIDWTENQKSFEGWHLVYADQCPWHEKSVKDLTNVAKEFGVKLKVSKIDNAKDAQAAPSGFGTFSLVNDGKLLEDHYLSATRFKSIMKKELNSHV